MTSHNKESVSRNVKLNGERQEREKLCFNYRHCQLLAVHRFCDTLKNLELWWTDNERGENGSAGTENCHSDATSGDDTAVLISP